MAMMTKDDERGFAIVTQKVEMGRLAVGGGQRTAGTVVGERVAGKEAKEGSEAGVSGATVGRVRSLAQDYSTNSTSRY